ncbi:MAG: glycogen debranching enzyme N-terminal domain-containing protein, partial [Thermodesulfobacteriota bacterium]
MIQIDCSLPASQQTDREWLESDGQGGYASSTLDNCHTRRYHGLMVASLPSPEGRYVLFSKLEDSLAIGEQEHHFSAHRYPGLSFPPGPPPLKEFRLELCPRFLYRAGEVVLQKSVLLLAGGSTLLIRYDLIEGPPQACLRLKPFIAFRNHHALTRQNSDLRGRTEAIENGFMIEPYAGMPPLFFQTSTVSRFTPTPLWYNRFEYTEEKARGFDWQEDLFL